MTPPGDEPAFLVADCAAMQFSGMSLRDWFAGQALVMLPHMGCGADLDTNDTANDTAIAAYQIADAMMREREKRDED